MEAWERAVAHVATMAVGGPAEPSWREFTALGAELAEEGRLDPRILGKVAGHDEQDLKRAWHLLARFGNQETS